jgi:heme/copper-type cytochrome/quinol oxidase subunit 2
MRLSFATGLFWTSVACCALAQLLILRSVIEGRRLPEPAAGLPRRRGGLELLWAVVPAAALAALLVATGHAVYRMGGAGRASAQTNGAPHVAPGVEGVR